MSRLGVGSSPWSVAVSPSAEAQWTALAAASSAKQSLVYGVLLGHFKGTALFRASRFPRIFMMVKSFLSCDQWPLLDVLLKLPYDLDLVALDLDLGLRLLFFFPSKESMYFYSLGTYCKVLLQAKVGKAVRLSR